MSPLYPLGVPVGPRFHAVREELAAGLESTAAATPCAVEQGGCGAAAGAPCVARVAEVQARRVAIDGGGPLLLVTGGAR